jgi:uncharacterized membrane protein YdjX (TVP38/TMEM64 family)
MQPGERACHPRPVDNQATDERTESAERFDQGAGGDQRGADQVPAPERPARQRRLELALALGSIALGAALIALIPDLQHAISLVVHGHLTALRNHIRGLGFDGVLLLFGLMMVHAVLFYPTEIVTATAGFVYGFVPGLGLAMGGWLASALFAFVLGRILGRPVIRAVFGADRVSRLEQLVERGGTPLLLAVRLIPIVPFSLMCYVAGAVGVNMFRFAWTTVVGFLPLTAAVAYFGSQAKSLSASDPLVWVMVAVVLALLLSTRLINLNRTRA